MENTNPQKIFNNKNIAASEAELEEIKDTLYKLAEILVEQYLKSRSKNDVRTSNGNKQAK